MGYEEPHLSMIEFKNIYPIYAFDLSNLPESIDGGDMTIYIEKSKERIILSSTNSSITRKYS